MRKDWDEGNKKIEGIFGQIGLGNQDAEKVVEFVEEYQRVMDSAELQQGNKKNIKFEDVMNETESNNPPEDAEIAEEEESS
ncbi:MAG TPA: hypothetical protein VLH08_15680 [Acidobacteriota bacterium]|nr:hypothetical protein [Acidobacteriota bacterium]